MGTGSSSNAAAFNQLQERDFGMSARYNDRYVKPAKSSKGKSKRESRKRREYEEGDIGGEVAATALAVM
jgi:hypothetical protein